MPTDNGHEGWRFPDDLAGMDVVLCHDWLTGMRGGERCLEILCQAFPSAPILTLLHDPAAVSETINRHPIITSWLQKIPGIARRYRSFLPFFPSAIERLKAPPARLLISTSHCVAKGASAPAGARHLCYCFTPMRYAWTFFDEYFGRNPLKAAAAALILLRLRAWDRRTAASVHRFVAISRHVQRRIWNFYGRDSDVVYPPVDLARLTPGTGRHREFDLIVSALVPYKRIALAVRTYNRLDYSLKIVGTGSEARALRAIAGRRIEFMGWQSDEAVRDLYRNCRLLVFPGEEDFGLAPVEAMACGRPVVAFRKGGVTESVAENVSGVFFDAQTESSLAEAVEKAAAIPWEPDAIRAQAERFSVQAFIAGFTDSIRKCLNQSRTARIAPGRR
ncbi:MAG: glycosyltransferase [Verrucomicrobiota bacterium]|nr:glycosyltransferase [Verrucomicrobiota bacterium]